VEEFHYKAQDILAVWDKEREEEGPNDSVKYVWGSSSSITSWNKVSNLGRSYLMALGNKVARTFASNVSFSWTGIDINLGLELKGTNDSG